MGGGVLRSGVGPSGQVVFAGTYWDERDDGVWFDHFSLSQTDASGAPAWVDGWTLLPIRHRTEAATLSASRSTETGA
jgi:hypothetical protein